MTVAQAMVAIGQQERYYSRILKGTGIKNQRIYQEFAALLNLPVSEFTNKPVW
jgi:hypothetical protein